MLNLLFSTMTHENKTQNYNFARVTSSAVALPSGGVENGKGRA